MRKYFKLTVKRIITFITLAAVVMMSAGVIGAGPHIDSYASSAEDAFEELNEVSSGDTYSLSRRIDRFEKLSGSAGNITLHTRIPERELLELFPDSLVAYTTEGKAVNVSVSWSTAEDYDAGDVFFYVYDPTIEGYEISEGVEIPYIVVWIDEQAGYSFVPGTCFAEPPADAGSSQTDEGTVVDAVVDEEGSDKSESETDEGAVVDEEGSDKSEGETDESTVADETGSDTDSSKDTYIPESGKTNEEITFDFLVRKMGLCEAAAVGVLANIKAESNFNPNAMGDKVGDTYTSYGICQWHNARWTKLQEFCASSGEDWESLIGQLKYLEYELENKYTYVLSALRKVSNTPEGAYDAGYVFCAKFEIPANTAQRADARGRVARDTFWPKYGGYVTSTGELYIWKTIDGKSYWYENGVRQGTSEDSKGIMGDGSIRGREIYDPLSDGWYWLDAVYDGAKAVNKEVWIPYIYNGEESWDEETIVSRASACSGMEKQVEKGIRAHGTSSAGKWVRYDENGAMIKGWYTVAGEDVLVYPDQVGNTYYYDQVTGYMAKGYVTIDGNNHYFNEITGVQEW